MPPRRPSFARRARRLLGVAAAILATAGPLRAQIVVSVCFGCEGGGSRDAYGRSVGWTPSDLTGDQIAAVLAHMQANFDHAVGPGLVKVVRSTLGGPFGPYGIIVSGGTGPAPGTEFGNAGLPGGPGFVYAGEMGGLYGFLNGFVGESYTNAIATAAAHEVGHKLGLRHNTNDPKDKMAGTRTMTNEDLQGGTLRFNAANAATLSQRLALESAEPEPTDAPRALRVLLRAPPRGPDPVIDHTLDVVATFVGSPGMTFGYRTLSDEFALIGTAASDGRFVGDVSFAFTGGWDFAVLVGGTVYDLVGGAGVVALSDPNPFTAGVFRTATLTFATATGPAQLTFRVADATEPDGFVSAVPEPARVALFGGGLVILWAARTAGLRRHRNPGRRRRALDLAT